MFVITNFRPEDMPGAKKKPSLPKKEATQTAETDQKPTASRTSRKSEKSAQKPSRPEA